MDSKMSVSEAIRERRSIGRVKADEVPKEWVEQILEAGSWAPSHGATEPWRFFVMTGGGRQILAEAYADIAAAAAGELTGEAEEALRSKNGAKAFRAPVVIAIGVSPSKAKGVIRIEEYAAAHAAVQNMMLEAHAMGLGTIWRTGEPCYNPRMKQAFGLAEDEDLVGLLYMGFPDMTGGGNHRRPVQEKTVWFTS